jgi:hypothetical protein
MEGLLMKNLPALLLLADAAFAADPLPSWDDTAPKKALFGRLDRALDETRSKSWTVVDMKNDRKIIYAFEKK